MYTVLCESASGSVFQIWFLDDVSANSRWKELVRSGMYVRMVMWLVKDRFDVGTWSELNAWSKN